MVIQVTAIALLVLFMSGSCLSATFVRMKIFPEHVGVFTTDGKQQFVAFGYKADGSSTNITEQVDWESSNKNIVTINPRGLATVVSGKTSGQVKINCSYPKTTIVAFIGAINLLLLTPPEEEPIVEKPVILAIGAIKLLLL